jgi:hypothetical protein
MCLTKFQSICQSSQVKAKEIREIKSKAICDTHVDSSIVHNHWKMKAIQVFTNGWMEKKDVVHAYNGVLSSLKKGTKFWHLLQ